MKVAFLTLGCKVNQAEASAMETDLISHGFEVVPIDQNPDLCIINTCTVTAKSDYQSRQLIRKAHRVGAEVLVTGCYSEINPEAVLAMPGVRDVICNKDKDSLINKIVGHSETVGLSLSKSRARHTLKVQDGCNSSCSYCIIPKARGRSRSLPLNEVIDGVKRAVDAGFQEIVLTGIHLGQYGRDFAPKMTLSGLIEAILAKTDIKRLRLSSLEVREVDERLMELLIDPRICRHLHIPLQSGDNSILKLMNRNYSVEYYAEKATRIKEIFPEICLGADIIVGFPGEGDTEFEDTYKFVESLPMSYLHVFPFSPRPGTRAIEMDGRVMDSIKSKRCSRLRALSDAKKTGYAEFFVGKTLDVLIEESTPAGICRGTTSNYLKVEAEGGSKLVGTLAKIRVLGMDGGVLHGTLSNSA